jgi:hypothetical protein
MLAAWRNGWIDPPAGEESQVLQTPPDAAAAEKH